MTVIPREATALVERIREALAGREPSFEAVDGARPAAVLVPLQYHDGGWHVILNVRSQHVGEHRGEIAFPGGKYEASDEDMIACALREMWEEMGVAPEDVDVLGPLNAVHTRTNYLVWPTVGVIPPSYPFIADANEVAEVIEIRLDDLLNGDAVRHEARLGPDGVVTQRVAYAQGEHLVFGATAWILAQLVDLAHDLLSDDQGPARKETA